MIIALTVQIEVDDDMVLNEEMPEFTQTLNEMEEVVGKKGYDLYDSTWEEV